MENGRLSRQERIALQQVEGGLADEDPAFVVRFRLDALAMQDEPPQPRPHRWSPRVYWDDPS
jgi:hypothetical protein